MSTIIFGLIVIALVLAAAGSLHAMFSAYSNQTHQMFGGLIGFILSIGFLGLLLK